MDIEKLKKRANEFWNSLTQEEFEKMWDELELSKHFLASKVYYDVNSITGNCGPECEMWRGIKIGSMMCKSSNCANFVKTGEDDGGKYILCKKDAGRLSDE